MHVVLAVAEVVVADGQGDVGDLDLRVQLQHRLHPHQHRARLDAMGIGDAAEAQPAALGVEMQLAGMAGDQDAVLQAGAGCADGLLDIQGVVPVAVAEADIVAGEVEVPRGTPVMEADAEHDAARRQVGDDMHHGMQPGPGPVVAGGAFQPRRADAAEDEGPVAHADEEAEDRRRLIRESPPEAGVGEQFEDLGVVVGPGPDIAIGRVFGLRHRLGRPAPAQPRNRRWRRRWGVGFWIQVGLNGMAFCIAHR